MIEVNITVNLVLTGTNIDLTNSVVRIIKAEQKKVIMGDDLLYLSYESPIAVNHSIGDTITIFGEKYTLNLPPNESRNGAGYFIYDLIFESRAYDLLKILFLDIDKSGNNWIGRTADFTLTGPIERFLTIIPDNITRAQGNNPNWKSINISYNVSDLPTDVKTLTFNSLNCLQALQQICKEFDVQYHTEVGSNDSLTFYINKKTDVSVFPDTLEYGYGGGLYDIKREVVNTAGIVTKLFAYGGTRNIPSNYRNGSPKLKLPISTNIDSYVENTQASDKYGVVEQIHNFDDVYPVYKFVVSGADGYLTFGGCTFDLNAVDAQGQTIYLIPGNKAKVSFITGELAGYEFTIDSFKSSNKAITIAEFTDSNGMKFPQNIAQTPSGVFCIKNGDEFILTDIIPDNSKIIEAETKLLAKANEYLSLNSTPEVTYSISLDEYFFLSKYASEINGGVIVSPFVVGQYLRINDADMNISNLQLRINGMTRDVLNPFRYTIEISNTVRYTLAERIVADNKATKEIIIRNNLQDPIRAKRNWQTTSELATKLDTLRAEMLLIGDDAGSYYTDIVTVVNFNNDPNGFKVFTGTINHQAYENNTNNIWLVSSIYTATLGAGAYYVYFKCSTTTQVAVVVISQTKIKVDEVADYFHFPFGIISSAFNGQRLWNSTRGYSQIVGGSIKTGRIQSADGTTYFDLDSGEFKGAFKFTNGTSVDTAISTAQSAAISTAATDATTKVNNLQIGGRNLLIGGTKSLTFVGTGNGTTEQVFMTNVYADLVAGQTYIFNCKTDGTWGSGTGVDTVEVLICKDGAYVNFITINTNPKTFIPTQSGRFKLRFDLNKSNTTHTFSEIKLEAGNKATGWVPSPEDVEADIAANISYVNAIKADLQSQIDGNITSWFFDYDPLLTNVPASSWGTDAVKDIHLGDLFYWTSKGWAYRFQKVGSVYSWTRIADTDVTKALADAATAQTIANGKMQTFSVQPTPPYAVGDLWLGGSAGDLKKCKTAKAVGGVFSSADWELATKYTDDTAVNNLQIGGRNIFVRANAVNGYLSATGTIIVGSGEEITSDFIPITAAGLQYSIWTTVTNASLLQMWTGIAFFDANKVFISRLTTLEAYVTINSEVYYSYNLKTKYAFPANAAYIRIGSRYSLNGKVKLEQGDKATDWTPAPEDVQANIDAAQTAANNAQTAANNAQTSANTANALLTDIASDSKLTPSEKHSVRREWDIIASEKTANDSQADTFSVSKTAYGTAFQALATYLNNGTTWVSGVPNWITDANLSTATTIVGATFRSTFKAYYDARTALLNAIAVKAKDLAISTAATDATNKVDAVQIGGRNYAQGTAVSKVKSTWNGTTNQGLPTYTINKGADWQVGDTITISFHFESNSVTWSGGALAMINQGNGNITGWGSGAISFPSFISNAATSGSLTNTDAIIATSFILTANHLLNDFWTMQIRFNFVTVGTCTISQFMAEKSTKASNWTPNPDDVQANIDAAQTAANTANALLSDIADDNKLTPSEKPQVRKEWDIIAAEKVANVIQANSFSIVTERDTYTSKFQLLADYLNDGIAWTTGIPARISDANLSVTTVITGSLFRSKFKDYYDARTALLNAIAIKAKDIAISTAASDATTKANAAQSAAISTAATDATTKVNNIKIGGRNLVIGSSEVITMIGTGGGSTEQTYTTNIYVDLVAGTEYTFSCKADGVWGSGIGVDTIEVFLLKDKTTSHYYNMNTNPKTFSPTVTGRYYIRCDINKSNTTHVFSEFKVEAGNKATGWAPAPEDVKADIDTKDNTKTTIDGGLVTTGTIELKDGNQITKAGITAKDNGDTAVRLWAGETFANRANAPFKVSQNGEVSISNTNALQQVLIACKSLDALSELIAYSYNNVNISPEGTVGYPQKVLHFASSSCDLSLNNAYSVTLERTSDTFTLSADAFVIPGIYFNLSASDINPSATISYQSQIKIIRTSDQSIVWTNSSSTSSGAAFTSRIILGAGSYKLIASATITAPTKTYAAGSLDITLNIGWLCFYYETQRTYLYKNGIAIIDDSNKYLYASLDDPDYLLQLRGNIKLRSNNDIASLILDNVGVTIKGKTDMPGVLATGSISAGSGHTNKWGAKTSSYAITKGGTGIFIVPHSINALTYTIQVSAGLSGYRASWYNKTTASFYVAIHNSAGTLVDAPFDYTLFGTN